MVCADSPIITAGAAFAQTGLMLQLLRGDGVGALSAAVSRVLLIDGCQAQSPYIVAEVLANGDSLVTQVIARIEAALPLMTEAVEEAMTHRRRQAHHRVIPPMKKKKVITITKTALTGRDGRGTPLPCTPVYRVLCLSVMFTCRLRDFPRASETRLIRARELGP